MDTISTTVGHHLTNMFPDGIALTIATFLEETGVEKMNGKKFEGWRDWVLLAEGKGERREWPRYTGNLKYGAFFVYSYGIEVIEICLKRRTVKRLGKWSRTTSTHMNYAMRNLTNEWCGFREIK